MRSAIDEHSQRAALSGSDGQSITPAHLPATRRGELTTDLGDPVCSSARQRSTAADQTPAHAGETASDPAAVSWIDPRLRRGETRRVLTGIPGKTGDV